MERLERLLDELVYYNLISIEKLDEIIDQTKEFFKQEYFKKFPLENNIWNDDILSEIPLKELNIIMGNRVESKFRENLQNSIDWK